MILDKPNPKRRFFKTIFRVISYTLLTVFVLVYFIVALLNTTVVQSITAAKLSDYFSKEWKTELRIGALGVNIFDGVGLHDVFLADRQGDTILLAKDISVKLLGFPSAEGIKISRVKLDNTIFNLAIDEKGLNFGFIIDYFASDKPPKPKTSSKPFIVDVRRCRLNNVSFSLQLKEDSTQYPKNMVAINNMQYKEINADIQNIIVVKDSINVQMNKFSAKECSGLFVKNISGKFRVSPKGIYAENANLRTSNSNLNFNVKMHTSTWKTYSHFIDSVYIKGEIKKGSIAGMKDATYWTDVLEGSAQRAIIGAKFDGKISDLHCEEIELTTGNETFIKAKGTIVGLPKPENTVYDIYADELRTSYKDYKSMQLGKLLNNLPIPEMVDNLGKIDAKARFSGLINNFDAAIELNTEIGDLDIIGSSISNEGNTTYFADIVALSFDVGQLLSMPLIHTSRFGAKAEVSGNSLDNLNAKLIASLSDFSFKGNMYDTIFVDGAMIDKTVVAQCFISDDAAKMEASGEYFLGDKKSLYVDANIDYAIPSKLNLFNFSDTSTSVSGKIIADIQDLDPKTITGNVSIEDLNFKISDTNSFGIKHFNANMTNNGGVNNLKVYSDIIDISMVGHYAFDEIAEDISWVFKKYVPDFSFLSTKEKLDLEEVKLQTKDTTLENYNIKSTFEYSATIKDAKPIFSLFAPQIQLSNNTAIYGKCSPDKSFDLNIDAQRFSYANLTLDDISFASKTNDDYLNTTINSSKFQFADSLYLNDVNVDLISNSEKLDMYLLFAGNNSDNLNRGRINFKSLFTGNSLQGGFEDSQITLMGNEIMINNDNIISYDGKNIAILNLSMYKPKESITINGTISDKNTDKLDINFNNLDISVFNPLLKSAELELKGRLNRSVTFSNLLDKPFFTSNLIVDSLCINDNLLGLTNLDISNTVKNDQFAVDVKFLYKGSDGVQNTPLEITGFIYPTRNDNNLDLNISMQNFNLKVIEKYLSSFASETEGLLTGENIKIKGSFKQPDIRGVLVCDKGAIKIDFINTKYFFQDKITIENNKFIFNDFLLKDAKDNTIKIKGTVIHHNFQDYYLNLFADANKINILNTKASSGQMYYGEAYVSAKASILGDLSMLDIDVEAKTEKGTKLTVPISSKTSVSQNSFVKFTDFRILEIKDSLTTIKEEEQQMELNVAVRLAVTPDAVLSFPMNFNQIGGSLLATTEGDLKIEADNKGDLNMYGTVFINNGAFNMSIMNVLDKTFQLEKGGNIQFNGKPTDASINVSAIYKTKASLASILGSAEYSKPVDVHSIINLSGNMMNPIPKFDIKLPNTDAQTVDRLFTYIDRNNEKQMLEQTMSLLLRRQFYASTVASNETSPSDNADLSSSAFELAFGQISGLLSNMITFVDVGVNYTPGTEIVSDQFDVNLSKSFGRWDIEFNSVFGGKTEEEAKAASSFIGDVKAEYKITESFRFKVFNKSNANDFTKYNITPYTQGIGITYKKEYDSFADIFKSKKQREKVLK